MLEFLIAATLSVSCPSTDRLNLEPFLKTDIEETAQWFGEQEIDQLSRLTIFDDPITPAISFPISAAINELTEQDHIQSDRVICLLQLFAQSEHVHSLNQQFVHNRPEDVGDRIQTVFALMAAVDQRNRDWLMENIDQIDWRMDGNVELAAIAAVYDTIFKSPGDLQLSARVRSVLYNHNSSRQLTVMDGFIQDRISITLGQLQRYGSYGRCADVGLWSPALFAGTIDHVNSRRESIGMSTLAEQAATYAPLCSELVWRYL